MSADQVLALDVGTQSVRAMVFDPRGTLVGLAKVPIEPYVPGPPGCCEQDPDLYWRAIGEACQRLWGNPHVRREALAGVALTTQRGTVVVTDEAGTPLRRAMVWLDRCRAEGLPRIGGKWGLAFRAAGATETVAMFMAEAEANVLAGEEPETWARIGRYLFLSGYLAHHLTGRFVDSVAAQVGYVPFDYKALRWAKDGDWKWQAIPVRREWLPELVPPGGRLGEITAVASDVTGIPAGLPLIAAAGDKACEVLGSGVLEPGVGAISLGTTATVNTTHRTYVEVIPIVPPYPAAVPGAYSLEVNVYRGYWMIEWFKREFGAAEVARAAELGVPAEQLFDELLASTPPGSMGLVLQPYWSPGVRVPGPEAKGAVIGWGDVHTRAHLYRAILEGLAYALREGAERTVKRTGVPISELRVSGGGSQSPSAVQLTADIFGLPASRPHTHETSGLGAAIDAAVGLGLHPSFEAAVAAMTRVVETRDPDPAAHAVYEDLYRNVYLRLYERLRPLYEEIRRITGYPPEA
ncbi:MAG TPA: FGGY-family carbohydrate kinase [Candidatus Limnocylindrales bacterium]|nr:FGGY-family carbohydrate kinase [Candidatus Limnocylindrales bacterium]